MTIKLPDGEISAVENESAFSVLMKKDPQTARAALACEINGKVTELSSSLKDGDELKPLTFADEEGRKVFWHTTSHVLAQAVKRLYPEVKLAIGPAIETGFYYDFDTDTPFTPEMLDNIEGEMKKIVKEGLKLERFVLSRNEALELMKDEPYKTELINELGSSAEISFYKQGDFTDLCAGPHLFDVSKIKAIKLLSATGAYWRGDSNKKNASAYIRGFVYENSRA